MRKRLNKKIGVVLAAAMVLTSIGMNPNTVLASGTERSWSLSLPHNNGNYYFPFRIKETNEVSGYATVKEMESSGVAIWFNKGTETSNAVKITDVVKFTKTGTKTINYNSNSAKGTSVDMGIENSDRTLIFRDYAAGVVNYK